MAPNDIIHFAIKNKKTVKIQYSKFDGELSERTLSDIAYSVDVMDEEHINEYELNKDDHITAFCHLRQEKRTFNIQRVITARIIE